MSHATAKLAIAALMLGSLGAAPALAQMPPDIAAKVKALGRVVDPPDTAKIYAPLQPKPPYEGVSITRDIAYGSAPLQKLDVFTPTKSKGDRPVLVFVHGGAFVRGDKHEKGTPFYDNILVWAVQHGMVGVNMNYRLAPKHPYPAAQQDIAAALSWVHDHIKGHGGDPSRVFLMGHSAGAIHIATYVAHPEFWAGKGPGIDGAILVSGEYDFTKEHPPSKPTLAYYGSDTSKYAARSSLAGLLKSTVQMLVAHGELDPPMFEQQAEELNAAL
jgi:triacylglycerol lipase